MDYLIHTDYNIFDKISNFISERNYSKYIIIVDENTIQYCLPQLIDNVKQLSEAELIEIPSGEENKTIEIVVQIWHTLTEYNADRNALIINLGGGVICDLGGFVASTFKRGLDFINTPTTLLAMVDAGFGGKTGINFDNYKNYIGILKNPVEVFNNIDFLKTLPKKELISAFAEIIKYSLISKKLDWNIVKLLKISDIPESVKIINICTLIKKEITDSDFNEKNLRKILNFGHTIGHAIEEYSISNDKKYLTHGESVAIGLFCETYISSELLGFNNILRDNIFEFLKSVFKKYSFTDASIFAIIELMKNDKKNENQNINFTLLKNIGEPVVNQICSDDIIKDALFFYKKNY